MKSRIQGLVGLQTMHVSEVCANCSDMSRCTRRDFSEQAWTMLLLWNEVAQSAVDKPICQSCYNELREVLIDRSDEIEEVLAESSNDKNANRRRRERIAG